MFGLGQSQRQAQVDQQVVKRQLMLDQLDKTFQILNNYFTSLARRDTQTMSAQNVAAASGMNALRAQVTLAQMRGDRDVLLMGLAKVGAFSAQLGDGGDDRVNGAIRNYVGFMNAILSGQKTDVLPCVAMPDSGERVNEAVSDILGISHETDRRVKQIENRPHESAEQQARLLNEGRQECLDRNGRLLVDVSYNMDELLVNFSAERHYYDAAKSRRKGNRPEITCGPGGVPNLGFCRHGSHENDEDGDEQMRDAASSSLMLIELEPGKVEKVEVMQVNDVKARVRRRDGSVVVVKRRQLRRLR